MTVTKKMARRTITQSDQATYKPIAQRIQQPTPVEIRSARKAAGLTQTQAAALVSTAKGRSSYRAWQGYEAPIGQDDHRDIPLPAWEMFLLLTNQHQTMMLIEKHKSTEKSGE